MKILLLIGVLVAVLQLSAGSPVGNGTESDDGERILNGRVANQIHYPYQVSIQLRQQYQNGAVGFTKMCGGVILANEWILTAAHCFAQFPTTDNLGINAGVLDAVNYQPPSQYIPIYAVYFPKAYNSNGHFIHDIAMVKLRYPLKFTSGIQAISLPPKDYEPSGTGEIIGWGLTNGADRNSESRYLLTGTVTLSDLSVCAQFQTMSGNQICVGYNSYVNACNGDSGGPFIQYFDGKPKVVGITSFGTVGCPPGHPSIYTKVAAYLDWIHDVATNPKYSTPESFYNYYD